MNLEYFLKNIVIKMQSDDLSPCEFVNRSRALEENPLNMPRFSAQDISSRFPYLRNFIESIQRCLFSLPTGSGVFDKEIGYRHPTADQIADANQRAGRPPSIPSVNASKEDAERWLFGISDKLHNRSPDPRKASPYFQPLLGKVGSGKSTFISFLIDGFGERLAKERTLVVRIQHNQIVAAHNQSESQNEKLTSIRNTIVHNICAAFRESTTIRKLFGNSKNFSILFETYCRKLNASFARGEAYRITDSSMLISATDVEKANLLVKFLAFEHNIRFIIFIDGMDILSFDAIAAQEYSDIFSNVSSVVFSAQHPDLGIPGAGYIVTLRNCTYRQFIQHHPEQVQHTQAINLIPCDFEQILERGIQYTIREYKLNASYWISSSDDFIWFWLKIVSLLKEGLEIKSDESLAAYFDNNHRLIMNGVADISVDIISRLAHMAPDAADIHEIVAFAKQNTTMGNKFASRSISSHDVFEMFLLGNSQAFINKMSSIGNRLVRNNRSARIDNLFNYVNSDTSQSDIPNFMLVKVRILQFIDARGYSSHSQINSFLNCLGYTISYDDLQQSLDILHNSRLVKTSGQHNNTSYNITNLGKLAVSRLMKSMRYLENVAQTTLVPSMLTPDMRGGVKNTQKMSVSTWISNSIVNVFILLQTIYNIEKLEADTFEQRGKRLYRDVRYRIGDTIHIDVLQFAMTHFNRNQNKDDQNTITAIVADLNRITCEVNLGFPPPLGP